MLDPPPPEMDELIQRRKRLGLDGYDEVWEGVYHMAPMARSRHGNLQHQLTLILAPYVEEAGLVGTGPFNLGHSDKDFRVPDLGYHRGMPDPEAVYLSTAALVVEVVSPGDETYDKLPFYASHGVGELIVVEPDRHAVLVLALAGDHYDQVEGSAVLGVEGATLEAAIRWP